MHHINTKQFKKLKIKQIKITSKLKRYDYALFIAELKFSILTHIY